MGKCICCKGSLKQLMSMSNMPAVAQHMPSEEDVDKDKGINIDLCQCESCGLIQFDIEPVWYYKDVIRAGGGTSTMMKLRTEEYSRFLDTIAAAGIDCKSIIEIGCGKGEFLSMWRNVSKADNIEIIGIEHDSSLVEIAVKNGLQVYNSFAEEDVIFPEAPFDAFVQFNFLEHQPNPVEMLKCARRNLTPNGYGLITVPSFEYIQEHDGYYELMRDHIAYYTFESLTNVVRLAGFTPVSSRMVNRDTIEMIIKVAEEAVDFKATSVVNVEPLEKNYLQICEDVNALTDNSLAIWGASHQAFTLAATTNLKNKAKYIIDSAEFKQGKYSPSSHIKIVSPDYYFSDPVDEILIVAPGYTDEIANIIKQKYGSNVHILILKEQRISEY